MVAYNEFSMKRGVPEVTPGVHIVHYHQYSLSRPAVDAYVVMNIVTIGDKFY